MKPSNNRKVIVIAILVLIIMLLALILLKVSTQIQEEEEIINEVVEKKPQLSIVDILKKYEVEFLGRDENHIKVKFSFPLYNEDGSSNEIKIANLINEIMKIEQGTFYLIDEENDIEIRVFYQEDKYPLVSINNVVDFYANTDPEMYVATENVEIVPSKNIYTTDYSLDTLSINGMKYFKLEEALGEKEGTDDNGYDVFDEGNIRVSKYEDDNRVRNIVYSPKYLNQFVSLIKEDFSLNKMVEVYGEPAFGSVGSGYVGYRNPSYYLFFYEDEISVYGYSYASNAKFETFLTDLLVEKDIAKFAKKATTLWSNYYEYKLDEEAGTLYLSYPSKGVEINITSQEVIENNYKGITFYSNYYFSDELLKEIKNGRYSLKAEEDLIHITELQRIKN